MVSELLKAVVVTRGRTGSSAITEELGKASFSCSLQEVFTAASDVGGAPHQHFSVWLTQPGRRDAPEADLAREYLDEIEASAARAGRKALFWKVLSQHFRERPYLAGLLAERGYKALCLRRNPARQAVSALVAAQRGVYNSAVRVAGARRYRVDVGAFRRYIEEQRAISAFDHRVLGRFGIPQGVAQYEDYLADRPRFFARVFGGLGLPIEVPAPSRFVVMIEDLETAVENLAEVRAAAETMGLQL